MTLLVFGKTGQVATELAAHDGVTCLGRAEADLTDPPACEAVIAGTNAKAVINAAAYTAVDRAEEERDTAMLVNAMAPTAMAAACAAKGIPFVHISTDYVFDGSGARPWQPGDPTGPVTNEDYAGCLVRFANGSIGTFESSRAIVGPQSQMAFEIYGTRGSIKWNLETMNEMDVFLIGGASASGEPYLHDGYTKVYCGDRYPFHGAFVPGDANSIGYEDLKVIECLQFLNAVASGRQHQPGFDQAIDYVSVQSALVRSWETGSWEQVESVRLP